MISKVLILVIVLCYSAFADLIVIEKKSIGYSKSERGAVKNALENAIEQIYGLSLESKRSMVKSSLKYKELSTNGKRIFKGIQSRQQSQVKTSTSGYIDSYEILRMDPYNDGFKANIIVTVKKYKTPGLNPKNRRAIAIVPSYTNQGSYSILGQRKSAKDASQRMTQELVSSITKTRKFTVLDREANSAYRNEKALLNSRDAATDELLKLGQVLGADYLLVSNLTELSVAKDTATAAIAANMSDNYKANATVQYRIIAMATRQIKWSNTMSIEFEPSGNSFEQVYLNTLKKVSENITTELMENIYPIKIVDTSSNQITINQGSLQVGQEFDVYKLGKRVYDSYTKESLGRTENKVGKIKIVRSIAKMSIAEVIEGKVSKGDICRTSKVSNSSTYFDNPTEADYGGATIKEGGGVVLPFD